MTNYQEWKAKTDGSVAEKFEHLRRSLEREWAGQNLIATIDSIEDDVEQVLVRKMLHEDDEAVCAMCGKADPEPQHITHAATGSRHHYHVPCLLTLADAHREPDPDDAAFNSELAALDADTPDRPESEAEHLLRAPEDERQAAWDAAVDVALKEGFYARNQEPPDGPEPPSPLTMRSGEPVVVTKAWIEPWNYEFSCGLDVSWVGNRGFGHIMVACLKETGEWRVNTEEDGPRFCGMVFDALLTRVEVDGKARLFSEDELLHLKRARTALSGLAYGGTFFSEEYERALFSVSEMIGDREHNYMLRERDRMRADSIRRAEKRREERQRTTTTLLDSQAESEPRTTQ